MDDIQKLKNHVAALERELNALWALAGNAAAPECRFRRPERLPNDGMIQVAASSAARQVPLWSRAVWRPAAAKNQRRGA